jgi:hypothetical protein
MTDECANVLLNVRKAYRLLNAYHERLLSLVRQLGEQFGERTFEAWDADERYTKQRWNPQVFENPYGLNSLQYAHFLFRPSDKNPIPLERLLDVTHVGDTCFLSDDYEAESLEPADRAQTQLSLSAFLVIGGGSDSWFHVWKNCLYPGDKPEQDKEIGGQRVWQGISAGCNVWGFRRTWSVGDFASENLMKSRCKDFQGDLDRVVAAARSQ